MQSSCNLIKNNNAQVKKIVKIKEIKSNVESIKKNSNIRKRKVLADIEALANTILTKAKNESKSILIEAKVKAEKIEKEAYEKGYNQGNSNGYEDGYKIAYEKADAEYKEKVSEILERCQNTLIKCDEDYSLYIDNKKKELLEVILAISKKISMQELEKKDGIIKYIESILEELKKEKNVVIKCNHIYLSAIKEKIEDIKRDESIKSEIFVIEDPLLKIGEVEVIKDNGKIVISADKIEDSIRSILANGIL